MKAYAIAYADWIGEKHSSPQCAVDSMTLFEGELVRGIAVYEVTENSSTHLYTDEDFGGISATLFRARWRAAQKEAA